MSSLISPKAISHMRCHELRIILWYVSKITKLKLLKNCDEMILYTANEIPRFRALEMRAIGFNLFNGM